MQRYELFNKLATAFCGTVFLRLFAKVDGAFISQRQRWRGVFAPVRTNENKTIHRFTRYSLCVWSTMQANYIGELCRANCIGEPHLNNEYKGLLGANYANRAHLVSVGKLSRKMMNRVELSA